MAHRIQRFIRVQARALLYLFAMAIADLRPRLALRMVGAAPAAGGDSASVGLKEAREKTVAAFKAFDEFAKANKIEDAHDLNGDTFSAEVKAQFNALKDAAWAADAEFVEIEKKEADGRVLTTARERMAYYLKAVTGRSMGFDQVYTDAPKSLGQQFIDSDAYKALKDSGALTTERQKFMTTPVTMAATDIITSNTGEGGAGLVTPQLLPGILPLPQRPLTVRELFSNSPMTQGDSLEYAAQVSFDNAANAVVQAAADGNPTGAKPQSSIGWARRTALATTIATWMAATRQMFQDAAQARSIIDNQGRLMIQLEEEDQLLSGNGTAPNLDGLQNVAGVQTLSLTGEDNLDGVRGAKTMVKIGLSRLNADAIVMHPNDSEAFDLMKDLEGRYRAGDPFGQYPDAAPIWRLRRVESEGVAEGTAIVGAFKAGATVFDRMPLTVYTSDSHSDYFIRNLIAVLFEERIAFPVFFPSAFVVITLAAGGGASGDVGVVT
jgi:HK97 family phage major capsid protein